LKIPELVPLTGTITYSDLAEKSKIGESVLKNMIRLVVPAVGFFSEPLSGHVGHSATSAIFVRNPGVAAAFQFASMSIPQSAINLYEALLVDPSGQDQNASAFRVTHSNPDGDPESIWDRLKRIPEENKWFMTTMKLFAKRPTYDAVHLVNGYDWSALQGKTVVDVSRRSRADMSGSYSASITTAIVFLLFHMLLSLVVLTQRLSVEAQPATWPQ
jgi:hypothetical protein